MHVVVSSWRRSILVRVVSTTLLLSLGAVALLGQLVVSQVRDGLLNAKTQTSLAQANAGFRTAEQRLVGQNATDPSKISQLITQITSVLKAQGGTSNLFEVVLLPAGESLTTGGSPRTTGGVQLSSVPDDLRRTVAGDPLGIAYRFITVQRDGSADVPGIAVGTQLAFTDAYDYQIYYVFPLRQEQEALNLVRRTLATVGLLLALLLAAVAYVITRNVVTPVRMAARVAERIAAGRLDERMLERGEDDLAKLASTFNDMATTLQRQIRQLEDLSRVQRRFVADVSHELRTPLATVRMAGDVLHEAREEFPPAVARSAELLHAQLDRFESLLTELLEISRFDAGAAVLEAEPADLRDLCRRVIDAAEPLAQRHGSRIRIDVPETACIAEVDTRRIERILRNLLVNALEHGEGRGVAVRMAQSSEAVAIVVRDHGVGLTRGQASMVFNRFWRADPARARTTGGTGLGLSIAMEDAHLHGGWLQAWGEPGDGSQFRLTLPKVAGGEVERSPLPLVPPDSRRSRGVPPASPRSYGLAGGSGRAS
jgi:two-component system sensor histidine kinase MtrB